jgi:PadR family transcriptional regulator, regulatory protein PadR
MPSRAPVSIKPLSLSAVAVLGAIASRIRYGFDIMDATALPSGTVYPILGRLERDGYVRSRWESQTTAAHEKRPPRRYYEVTAAGAKVLAYSVEHYRTLGDRLALAARGRALPE